MQLNILHSHTYQTIHKEINVQMNAQPLRVLFASFISERESIYNKKNTFSITENVFQFGVDFFQWNFIFQSWYVHSIFRGILFSSEIAFQWHITCSIPLCMLRVINILVTIYLETIQNSVLIGWISKDQIWIFKI